MRTSVLLTLIAGSHGPRRLPCSLPVPPLTDLRRGCAGIAAQGSCSDGLTATQAACEETNGNTWARTCLFGCTAPGNTTDSNGSPTSDEDYYSTCVGLGNTWSPTCNFFCTLPTTAPVFMGQSLSGADLNAAPTVRHQFHAPR